MVNLIRNSHERMACWVVHGRQLTDNVKVRTGVRQGCLLVLFSFSPGDWLDHESINSRQMKQYPVDDMLTARGLGHHGRPGLTSHCPTVTFKYKTRQVNWRPLPHELSSRCTRARNQHRDWGASHTPWEWKKWRPLYTWSASWPSKVAQAYMQNKNRQGKDSIFAAEEHLECKDVVSTHNDPAIQP